MPYVTLALGLTIKIPTNGTRNWGTEVYNNTWTKVSQHSHEGSGDGNKLDGSAALEDNSIPTVKLSKFYGLTQAATLTPAGTTQAVDLSLGNVFRIDLGSASGDVTVSVTNPAVGKKTFLIQQGATPRDIIWPAEFKWPGGEKPILSGLADDALAKVEAYYDGTIYWGDWDLTYS